MASILYRAGTSHTVDGVKCEEVRVEAWEVDNLLQNGYVADVKLLGKAPEADELPTDKDLLASIALEYGVTLDKRKTIESLQSQVMELMNGDKG